MFVSYSQNVMNYLPCVMNHLQTFASTSVMQSFFAKYGNIVKRTYMLLLMGITGLLLFLYFTYFLLSIVWLLLIQISVYAGCWTFKTDNSSTR